MSNSIVRISDLPVRTSDIDNIAFNFVEAIKEEGDPVKVMVQIKQMDTYLESIKKYLKSYAVDTICRSQETDYKGAKLEIRSPQKYDFTNCNDPVWKGYQSQIAELEIMRKGREMYLKSLKKKDTYLNEETGELVEIYPPTVTANETLYITLPKK